jgi:hypothetical protein
MIVADKKLRGFPSFTHSLHGQKMSVERMIFCS